MAIYATLCSGPLPAWRQRSTRSQSRAASKSTRSTGSALARPESCTDAVSFPRTSQELHRELNELRKGVFYEGDELEPDDISIEDTLIQIETAVEIAEGDERESGEEAS